MVDARWLWSSGAPGARAARAVLAPVALAYRTVTAVRAALYDGGVLRAHMLPAPAISVGNLTVGGTGKTPFANWVARQLAERGATPAILLRGYGGDEARVHEALFPGVVVVADADRRRGARAAVDRGADVLVLDDAFQHRRVQRDADIVLVSADAAHVSSYALPAGPHREPWRALRRATLVVVTRKAASDGDVERTCARVARAAPGVVVAVARLALADVTTWRGGDHQALAAWNRRRVLAVTAIGDPEAFERQLEAHGLVVYPARHPDHYPFPRHAVASLAARAAPLDAAICTLKDAVKLGPLWPPDAPPLWYVSQRVIVERGGEAVARVLATALDARRAANRLT